MGNKLPTLRTVDSQESRLGAVVLFEVLGQLH